MAQVLSSCYAVCLLTSVLVNIFFLTSVFYDGGKWLIQLSWSQTAAAEAEAVASVSCSGHGRAYLDGLVADGKPVCECNSCFQGPDCSEFVTDCAADVDRLDFSLISSSSPCFQTTVVRSGSQTNIWACGYRVPRNDLDHSFESLEFQDY